MASSGSQPWDRERVYLEAARTTSQPGDPTDYVVSPNGDPSNGDETSFIVGQAQWSLINLPQILYMIDPLPSRPEFAKSAARSSILDAQGARMIEQWPADPAKPRPLIDLAVLPHQIASNVEWWRVEAWRRLDPRIKWEDIIMRIRPDNAVRTASLQHDTAYLNNKIGYQRQKFFVKCWGSSRGAANSTIQTRFQGHLGAIASNSSRGVTPGLIDLQAPESPTNRVPLPVMRSSGSRKAPSGNLASNASNTLLPAAAGPSRRARESMTEPVIEWPYPPTAPPGMTFPRPGSTTATSAPPIAPALVAPATAPAAANRSSTSQST